jgi:RNA polymerase sigma factor (sigma-70 family)
MTMTKTTSGTVRDELRFLLHPADDRDVPVPGFPTHDALVAWAQSRPADELIDAAIEVLRDDDWPQQYATMGLLRALGADVEGVGYEDDFRWRLMRPGGRRARFIEPAVKERSRPIEPMGAVTVLGELEQARVAVASAINHLPERERIVVTLYYYESLSTDDIATVLGVSAPRVGQLHAKALRAIRRSISNSDAQLLAQIAEESPEAVGALALIRELAA